MKKIPDNSINLILCDLPYGTTQNKWDSIIPFAPLWEQYKRICKPQTPIVLFASQPFTSALIMSNLEWFKYEWIWHKNASSNFLNAKKMPLKQHENIVVFSNRACTYNPIKTTGHKIGNKATTTKQSGNYGKYNPHEYERGTERFPQSVIKFDVINNGSKERVHPTQKPLPLLDYLVRTYSSKGDLVLDNCMGSGTTGVACINNDRRFFGIEQNREYYDIASTRINNMPRKIFS
jgi:site-specific DNA-methyltransferase (adenine-specific)